MTSQPGGPMSSQSRLRPNSRIVGYGATLLVGLVVLFISWRIFVYTQLERDSAWVHFTGSGDLIGSLQEDDPVAVQGVAIGQVEAIESVRDGVRVRLRFWKHQTLWRDASATNVGNGLMGMRFVLLHPGTDSLHPLDRSADVPGTFHPGIAEVMSGIQRVVDQVRLVQEFSRRVARGDSTHEALPAQVLRQMDELDGILTRLEAVDAKVEPLGTKVQAAGRQGVGIARGLDSSLPALLDRVRRTDTALERARVVLGSVRDLSRRADGAVRETDRRLEPFTRDDSLVRRIESTLVVLDKVQAFLDGKAKARYNFHLWGDNPSKHGE